MSPATPGSPSIFRLFLEDRQESAFFCGFLGGLLSGGFLSGLCRCGFLRRGGRFCRGHDRARIAVLSAALRHVFYARLGVGV